MAVPVAADYPFLDVLWTMVVFFIWIAWFLILFRVLIDIFRRHDIGGLGKTGWFLFTILLPFLGVFVYVISQSDGMTERRMGDVKAQQAQFDQYVRQTAGTGGAASEIENAKRLLDSGTINQSEFDAIKAKALTA